MSDYEYMESLKREVLEIMEREFGRPEPEFDGSNELIYSWNLFHVKFYQPERQPPKLKIVR